ncbi:MAG TPA: WGR domain-containing protein [Tepidisphaeraceae bacterium]|jgi:bifunctional non-homologous end joining protein LigD|nr:WGR domain-containing protein [Tepidisphaeraceae bacterium]
MQTNSISENITLYYCQGSSDKVYRVAIEPSGPGFVVNFAYGRRGSTMNTGTKTSAPVGFDEAKKIYDGVVKEKTAKGYTPGEDGTPYTQTDNAQRATGIVPQLLNPIDEADIEQFIADDRWWTQEKFDGRRVLVEKRGDTITAINRNGLTTSLPSPILEAVQLLSATNCLLDGEAIGDVYFAFDLLHQDVTDMRASSYAVRHAMLMNLADGVEADGLRYAPAATGASAKRQMLAKLKKAKKEGVVFKESTAPYTPGRPASGGSQVKLKFYATASCIVAKVNGAKRSVAIELIDVKSRVSVGNVTIPPNQAIPTAGQILEVRYLYAYPGGSLYQPVYLGRRDDIRLGDCAMRQLKFKPRAATRRKHFAMLNRRNNSRHNGIAALPFY